MAKIIRLRRQPITKKITNSAASRVTITPSCNDDNKTKIAIIQTGCWGDNINSTLMLKPLREHWPNSVIDVHTSTIYSSAFYNNPYVDKTYQHKASDKQSALHLTLILNEAAKNRGYDHVLSPHPMFNPEMRCSQTHPELGENIILAWVRAIEDIGVPYTIPLTSVLRLTTQEIEKVSEFCQTIPSMSEKRNVLMEVHAESGQTFWNHDWTLAAGEHLLTDKNTNIFISRREVTHDIQQLRDRAPDRVHFVGHLSIRECAELFNRCQVFLSISSGLSNACNTDWCKNDIKWIETVNSAAITSAPIRSDGKIFWHDNNIERFIKMLEVNGL